MLDGQVLSWVARFSYPAVLAMLVATGVGAPISEELVFLTGGLVAAEGGANLYAMMATAFVGVLTADTLLYRLGRKLGIHAVDSQRFKKLLTPSRVAWVQGHFKDKGALTIFLARFVPGLRAPTFLMAGMAKMHRRTFLLADGAAAAINAPLMVFIGYRFGAVMLAHVRAVGGYLLGAVGVAMACVALHKIYVRQRRLRTGTSQQAVQDLASEPPVLSKPVAQVLQLESSLESEMGSPRTHAARH